MITNTDAGDGSGTGAASPVRRDQSKLKMTNNDFFVV